METTNPRADYAAQLQARLISEQENINQLREQLKQQLLRYGFHDKLAALDETLVNPDLRKDSFEGTQSLFAEWRTPSGALLGYVLLHGGGQLYAEFDVLQPHPNDKRWFIEAITAWGSSGNVKAEPRLLPALAE